MARSSGENTTAFFFASVPLSVTTTEVDSIGVVSAAVMVSGKLVVCSRSFAVRGVENDEEHFNNGEVTHLSAYRITGTSSASMHYLAFEARFLARKNLLSRIPYRNEECRPSYVTLARQLSNLNLRQFDSKCLIHI